MITIEVVLKMFGRGMWIQKFPNFEPENFHYQQKFCNYCESMYYNDFIT